MDDEAVVDPELRAIGIEGLRVADATVMPTAVCVNTNPAAIVIGEKAADLVLNPDAAVGARRRRRSPRRRVEESTPPDPPTSSIMGGGL